MIIQLLLVLLICSSGRASAQSPEPTEYRRVVEDAVDDFEAGRYEESRALFTRAHQILPNARTLRGLGMTEFELRNYPDAVSYLQQALASDTRRLTGELREQTLKLLEHARGFVVQVELVLSPEDAQVSLDGSSLALGADRRALWTVGEHVVEVRADGYEPERRVLSFKSGGQEKLTFTLAADKRARTSSAETASDVSQAAALQTSRDKRRRRNAWIVTGVSAGVLAAGLVMVGHAMKDVHTVEHASDGTRWADVRTENARAPVLSGAGIAVSVVGAAGLVAGLVWALKHPHADQPDRGAARLLSLASGHF